MRGDWRAGAAGQLWDGEFAVGRSGGKPKPKPRPKPKPEPKRESVQRSKTEEWGVGSGR